MNESWGTHSTLTQPRPPVRTLAEICDPPHAAGKHPRGAGEGVGVESAGESAGAPAGASAGEPAGEPAGVSSRQNAWSPFSVPRDADQGCSKGSSHAQPPSVPAPQLPAESCEIPKIGKARNYPSQTSGIKSSDLKINILKRLEQELVALVIEHANGIKKNAFGTTHRDLGFIMTLLE